MFLDLLSNGLMSVGLLAQSSPAGADYRKPIIFMSALNNARGENHRLLASHQGFEIT
jgi:hypothetical protein